MEEEEAEVAEDSAAAEVSVEAVVVEVFVEAVVAAVGSNGHSPEVAPLKPSEADFEDFIPHCLYIIFIYLFCMKEFFSNMTFGVREKVYFLIFFVDYGKLDKAAVKCLLVYFLIHWDCRALRVPRNLIDEGL